MITIKRFENLLMPLIMSLIEFSSIDFPTLSQSCDRDGCRKRTKNKAFVNPHYITTYLKKAKIHCYDAIKPISRRHVEILQSCIQKCVEVLANCFPWRSY